MPSMATERSYHSPLRQQQAEATRDLILDALVDLLNERGVDDFNIKSLASAAGVAERTVYRHFADRDELREALNARLEERADWYDTADMSDVFEFPGAVAQSFTDYDHFERETRAIVLMNLDPSRTVSDTRRHVDEFRALVERDFPHLDEDDTTAVAALFNLLASSRTWHRFVDGHQMTGPQGGKVVAWAADLVIRELAAGGRPPDPPPPPERQPSE